MLKWSSRLFPYIMKRFILRKYANRTNCASSSVDYEEKLLNTIALYMKKENKSKIRLCL